MFTEHVTFRWLIFCWLFMWFKRFFLPARLGRVWEAALLRGGRADGLPASTLHS